MSSQAEVILKIKGLCRRYGSTAAVDNVTFEVRKGEFFSLLGPSGCGKSTTLRLIAGLEELDGGDIWLKGEIIASARKNIFLPAEKRNIGLVFQSYAVWPHMTVAENVSYPLEVRRWNKAEIRRRTRDALQLVGLGGLENRRPSQLSGGQQQRLALARSLAYEPDLLLLDEPLSNVDAKLREQLRLELKKLQQSVGITIVYVTHDQSEAMSLSHRIAIMNAGRFEQVAEPEEIYKNPATFFVQSFVGRLITFEGRMVAKQSKRIVELPGCGSIEIFVPTAAPINDKIRVAVRPEDIQIEMNEHAPGLGEIAGTVLDVSYVGGHYECAVTAGGTEFVLETAPTLRLQKGQKLLLRLKELKLWPLRSEHDFP